MDSSQTSLDYQGFLPNLGPGTRIEIETETMLVTEVDSDNKTIIVVRGWLSSTAAAHAQGTPIFINPRFYRSDILGLVNDCLDDLFGQDLYGVGSQEIVYDPSAIGYEINAEAVSILRVDALKDSFAGYWEPIGDWLQVDNTDTADFSSGKAIMMRVALPPGAFRVIYSKPFNKLTAETQDLEADAGLRPYMTDLPFYYAMTRLMADEESHRSQIESAESHQRAQDNPGFLALRTGQWYQARYDDRIRIARTHLGREVKRSKTTAYGN